MRWRKRETWTDNNLNRLCQNYSLYIRISLCVSSFATLVRVPCHWETVSSQDRTKVVSHSSQSQKTNPKSLLSTELDVERRTLTLEEEWNKFSANGATNKDKTRLWTFSCKHTVAMKGHILQELVNAISMKESRTRRSMKIRERSPVKRNFNQAIQLFELNHILSLPLFTFPI